MKWTRRKYDDEFKRSAVKLVVDQDRSLSEVAKNLGVHENILHRWKREYLEDPVNAFPGIGHLKPEDEEMRKLKKHWKNINRIVQTKKFILPRFDFIGIF